MEKKTMLPKLIAILRCSSMDFGLAKDFNYVKYHEGELHAGSLVSFDTKFYILVDFPEIKAKVYPFLVLLHSPKYKLSQLFPVGEEAVNKDTHEVGFKLVELG